MLFSGTRRWGDSFRVRLWLGLSSIERECLKGEGKTALTTTIFDVVRVRSAVRACIQAEGPALS